MIQLNNVEGKIRARYESLNEYLPNEIFDQARTLLLNAIKIDDKTNSILFNKNNYPVLKSFDQNITTTILLFAENKIKIDPEIQTFDLWFEFYDNSYEVQGFAPKMDLFESELDYALELSKYLRDLVDFYTFDTISRLPEISNINDLVLFEYSRYLQNSLIYGVILDGKINRKDPVFDKMYTKDIIHDMEVMLKSFLMKLLNINNANIIDEIITAIENNNLSTLQKYLPKPLLNKLVPLVKNFGKLDIEYYRFFKELLPNMSNSGNMNIQGNQNSNNQNKQDDNQSGNNNTGAMCKMNNNNGNTNNQNDKNKDNNDNNNSNGNGNNGNNDEQQFINNSLSKYVMGQNDPNKKSAHEMFKQIVQDKLKETYEKIKGDVPANIKQILSHILRVKINWWEIFEKILGSRLVPSYAKSWHIPKKHLMHIVYLPGYKKDVTINNIAIMIDTSGSMSDEELMKALGIVYDLAVTNEVRKILIFQHDFELQDYKEFETEYLKDPKEVVKNIHIKGRGGTSHVIPLKKIFEMMDTGQIEEFDLLIIFSDFVSDFEEAHKLLEERGIDYMCVSTETDLSYIDKKRYPVIIIRN